MMGLYISGLRKMFLDKALYQELEDSERPVLKEHGLLIDSSEVSLHEYMHAAQEAAGNMDRILEDYKDQELARALIEGDATVHTSRALGKPSNVYPIEQLIYERERKRNPGIDMLKAA